LTYPGVFGSRVGSGGRVSLLAFAGVCPSGGRCARVWTIAGAQAGYQAGNDPLVGTPNMQNSFPSILTSISGSETAQVTAHPSTVRPNAPLFKVAEGFRTTGPLSRQPPLCIGILTAGVLRRSPPRRERILDVPAEIRYRATWRAARYKRFVLHFQCCLLRIRLRVSARSASAARMLPRLKGSAQRRLAPADFAKPTAFSLLIRRRFREVLFPISRVTRAA
jgi:hypothetical protein